MSAACPKLLPDANACERFMAEDQVGSGMLRSSPAGRVSPSNSVALAAARISDARCEGLSLLRACAAAVATSADRLLRTPVAVPLGLRLGESGRTSCLEGSIELQ